MKERSFIDTNVLIYTDDADEPEKQNIALGLLKSGWHNGNAILSTQVLQEYFSAATRKLMVPVVKAQRKIELLSHLEVASIQHQDIVRAIEIHRLHAFSFWDALIVTMAQKTACSVLYSEDMQDGQKIGGVHIVNPFKNTTGQA
jgi:predicted nucleic acid-binding protein